MMETLIRPKWGRLIINDITFMTNAGMTMRRFRRFAHAKIKEPDIM